MSNHLPPPAICRNAYTNVGDGWTRSTPWVRSTVANHYEAIYRRSKYGAQAAKVHIRDVYIVDATAAVFEINRQLKHANDLQRRQESRKRKRA
ncbi:hypothetical protein [Tardiphaga sp.]|jgi:hypothetical protein|uniref:hypothetical protein n=1 Tax=Tardiphaga sp. TaxID=1926292 RepID=UPI0037D9DFBA